MQTSLAPAKSNTDFIKCCEEICLGRVPQSVSLISFHPPQTALNFHHRHFSVLLLENCHPGRYIKNEAVGNKPSVLKPIISEFGGKTLPKDSTILQLPQGGYHQVTEI